MKCQECVSLSKRIREIEQENALLTKERDFFRRTPTLAQGLKGETLVATLTEGVLTGYKDPHDIIVKSGESLEVKYSHINAPNGSATRRWNWHSVLGMSNNKKYDYLILVGEKDARYVAQYPAELTCVFFLVPRSDVDQIKTGNDIAINTNLEKITAAKSKALRRFLVTKPDEFTSLIATAEVG